MIQSLSGGLLRCVEIGEVDGFEFLYDGGGAMGCFLGIRRDVVNSGRWWWLLFVGGEVDGGDDEIE